MVTGLWYISDPNFGSLSWFLWCQEHLFPLSPYLGALEDAGSSWVGSASWSWYESGHWYFIQLWSKFWLSTLILTLQSTSISFSSSFGALEDTGGDWLGFGILILIWIWPLAFDTTCSKLWLSILNFKVQRISMFFKSSYWALEDDERFLSGVRHLDLDLDIGTGLWYIHVSNSALYLEFKGWKKIHVLLFLIWGFGWYGVSLLWFGILILIWI